MPRPMAIFLQLTLASSRIIHFTIMCDPLFQIVRRLFRKYGIFPTIHPTQGKFVSTMPSFIRSNREASSLERAVPQLVTEQTLLPRLACYLQYQASVRTHGNDPANAFSVEINVVNRGIQAQLECQM